ncbi:MAG: hypothetical protein AAF928_01705 [Myxococcota bacterium]
MSALFVPVGVLAFAPSGCDGGEDGGPGGGDATTASGTTTSDGGAGGEGLVNPPTCNPVADDCVEPGTQCRVFFSEGGVQLAPTCAPTLGSAAEGESCERPDGQPGEDTCGAGLYCGIWGQPKSDPQTLACRAFCSDDDPCPDGSWCLALNGGFHGVCLPECDPLMDTCGDDSLTCSWINDARGGAGTTCWFGGSGQGGDVCDFLAEEHPPCGDGTSCLSVNGVAACRPFCDPNAPCTGDAACSLLPNVEPVGWCAEHDLSCLGSVTWPAATPGVLQLDLSVFEWFADGIPIAGASVKACPRFDLDCVNPLADGVTNGDGELVLEVTVGPEGFDGYFDIDAGYSTLAHLAEPITENGSFRLGGAAAPWLARAQAVETSLDPSRGHVFMSLASCGGAFGSGATMSVAAADASSTTQYWGPGGLRSELTSTDWRGYGLVFDVVPGMTTMSVRIGDGGPQLGTTDIPVRAGAVTTVFMEPTP